MLGSTSKSGRNSIASISASSMISMRSSVRSALKLRDNRVKREQNPRHGHYNGLTHKSRGNGGGLRPRVWLRLRAAAGGNWTPDGILQLEGEANFSLSWGT
jgi:hypothetical protein